MPEVKGVIATANTDYGSYEMMSELREDLLRRFAIGDVEDYAERFFRAVENVLSNGDQSSKDCVTIEILEGLLSHRNAVTRLRAFFGPETSKAYDRIDKLPWPKPSEPAAAVELTPLFTAPVPVIDGDTSVSALTIFRSGDAYVVSVLDSNGREITDVGGFDSVEHAREYAAKEFVVPLDGWTKLE